MIMKLLQLCVIFLVITFLKILYLLVYITSIAIAIITFTINKNTVNVELYEYPHRRCSAQSIFHDFRRHFWWWKIRRIHHKIRMLLLIFHRLFCIAKLKTRFFLLLYRFIKCLFLNESNITDCSRIYNSLKMQYLTITLVWKRHRFPSNE
jgi:hypothetical protein